MPNNNVAILSIMSKFDEKSAREAAKRADKVYEEALSDIGNINFDKKLIENFDKAMNLLKNKFKKVNLSSYTNSLLDSIFSDKDIKEKSKDIELFISKIEMLKKASSGQDINAFNTFSAKQIDALISRTEKLAQKQEEINEKTREYNREATKIAKANRNISTIDKNYGNQDYSKTLESLKKSLGTEKEFTAEQNQSIENLAKMVNLYQVMEKSEPQKGTAEAIRYSKDLLAVTQKIKEERDKIDAFSQKGASTYINNNGLSSIDKVSDYTVNKSKEDFVKASLSNLKTQEAKLQSELTTYISESVQKNLEKVSKEVDAVVDKAEKRVENLQNKIDSLQSKPTNTGTDNSLIGNVVSESDVKTLEEIKNRLYEISKIDANGDATNQQLKEYIRLFKQYEKLALNDPGTQFDLELKEEYDSIIKYNNGLKKYADTLDNVVSKQKEFNDFSSNNQLNKKSDKSDFVDAGKIETDLNEIKETIIEISKKVDNLNSENSFNELSSQVSTLDEKLNGVNGSVDKLVESIQLLSSLSLSDLQKTLIPIYNGINQVYQDKNGKQISGYWDDLKSEIENSNTALKELLSNIGLLNKSTNSVKLIDSGLNNSGGIIGDRATIIARKNDTLSGQSQYDKSTTLKAKLDEAYEAGVNVARILDIIGTKESKVILEVQETQIGGMLGNDNLEDITKSYVNKEYLEATDEQILKLIQDIQTLEKIGLSVDLNSNNLFYDKDKGFSIIDLSTDGQFFKSYEDMIEELGYAMQGTTRQIFEDLNNIEDEPLLKAFEERFTKLSKQAQDAYANAQDSNSPSKEFEKLENDAVDGIVVGANENEEKLKNVGRQMAENVKAGFKEGISEIGSEASSDKSNISSENLNSGNVDKVTNSLVEEQKAVGELDMVFRGLEGSLNGFMSNSGRLATFFTTSPLLARQYADSLGGVYQAMVALGKSLDINAEGRDWNVVEYLGDGSDEASRKIIELRKQIDNLYEQLNASGASGTGLDGLVEENRGDFSRMVQLYGDAGVEYSSYIEAVEKGNIIENQENQTVKQLMIQLYELEKAYRTISDAKDNVYGTHTTDEFAELAKVNGYDSVMFRNIKDSFDRTKNLTDVGVIFDESQVASVKNVSNIIDDLIQKIDGVKTQHGLNLPINIELPKEISRLSDGNFVNNLTGEIYDDVQKAIDSLKELDAQIESNPPIKDVFQGDNNSNTSFSSNLDEIEKEKSALLELRNTVSLIIEEIDRKTQAFHNEKSAVDLIIPEEIATLESLERELKIIIESIEQISKIPINIDFNLENLDENSANVISKLKDSLSDFNGSSLTNISSILEGFKISKANVENLQKLANAILTLKSNLNNVGNSGQQFLSDIKELVAQSDGLKDLATVLKSSQKQIDNAKKTTNANVDSKNTEKNANAWKELIYSIQRYSEVSKRISSGKALEGDIEEASRLENKISQLQKLDILSPTQIEKSEQMLIKLYDSLDDIEKKSKEATLESLNSSIDKYRNDYNSRSSKPVANNQSDQYKKLLTNYETSIAKLEAYRDKISNNPLVSKEDLNQIDELTKKVKDSATAFNSLTSSQKGSTPLSRGKTIEWANDLLEQNSKWSKKAKIEVQGWINKLATVDPSNVEEIRNRILEVVRAEREAGNAGKTWLDIFSTKKLHSFLGQAASMFSFYDLVNVGREGFQTIRELDTALTEMKKVSDETTQSLKNYQATTFDVGDAVGATAKTIQESTADWMRLGESINEAAESAKVSNILLNVSEFESIDEATESLVAMSQAYSELGKMDIIDVLNNIGNNYSISTDGLATALQKSASALKTANNDLNSAVALATAGNAVVQDPDSVGAGIRTISLRLVGTEAAKQELESIGEETDDVITTTSKLRDTILSATAAATNDGKGFDIFDSNGNYKSTYEIMQGLADLYDDIVAKDKELGTNNLNLLLETIAGKNRSNIAASILQNGEMLRSVYQDAQNSSGSAQKELDSYLDSIDGRMTQLENRAQEFWYKVIDSDTIKNGITLLTDLLELGTNIVDTFGVLPTIMAGVGAGLGIKNIGREKCYPSYRICL